MTEQMHAESAILIPVPEATALVRQIRLRYDPSAAAHIPEHITVLYPFLAPDMLDESILTTLQTLFLATAPFAFTLRSTAWFEQSVLYLAPEPAAPFIDLTQRVSSTFGISPFGGQYPEVIPHLTLAQHGPRATLMQIADAVASDLPLASRAQEAWLMVGQNETGWVLHTRFPFGAI